MGDRHHHGQVLCGHGRPARSRRSGPATPAIDCPKGYLEDRHHRGRDRLQTRLVGARAAADRDRRPDEHRLRDCCRTARRYCSARTIHPRAPGCRRHLVVDRRHRRAPGRVTGQRRPQRMVPHRHRGDYPRRQRASDPRRRTARCALGSGDQRRTRHQVPFPGRPRHQPRPRQSHRTRGRRSRRPRRRWRAHRSVSTAGRRRTRLKGRHMATTPARQKLRALLDQGELVVAPGVFDGITAHLARRTGQAAAYMTGAGVAASGFGLPDIGLVTGTEMAERARMLGGVLGDVPLIADADTGYGAAMNVVRTVRLYEQAGVAAIQLEDQVFPKRCGHLSDKHVMDAADLKKTWPAAVDARSDDDLLVVARTDARAPLGLDAAIERANRYAQAGADVIFVEAPQSIEEIERIARDVTAPLLINLVLGGMTPLESATRLQELGYAIAIHPGEPLARAVLGMLEGLCELNGGNVADYLPTRPAEFFNLVGMAEWLALDAKYTRTKDRSWA